MFDWQKHSDTIHTVVQGTENLHRQPTHRCVYFRLENHGNWSQEKCWLPTVRTWGAERF